MTADSFAQLVVVFSAGLGLLFAGGVNLLLRNRSTWIRAILTVLIISGVAVAVWQATDLPLAALKTGLVLLAVLTGCLLLESNRMARLMSAISSAMRVPALRWSLVALLGVGVAMGAVIDDSYRVEEELDNQAAELEALTLPPPTRPGIEVAATDLGHPIPINEVITPRGESTLQSMEEAIQHNPLVRDNIIRCSPATDRSNCHGWIFTGGRYWISGVEVDRILSDNHYRPVSDPKPGDLVVYRSGKTPAHTGLVRYVTEGYPVLVEGKWGCTGVYLHAVDKSLYGSNFTYYRSPRNGHLLSGLGNPPHTGSTPTHSSPIMPDPSRPDEFTE